MLIGTCTQGNGGGWRGWHFNLSNIIIFQIITTTDHQTTNAEYLSDCE